MTPAYLREDHINAFIDGALSEDLGSGDHTTLGTVPQELEGTARLLVKESGRIAGIALAEMIFHRFDPSLRMKKFKQDGDEVNSGDIAFEVSGPVRSILSTERLVLNCMQRMSGIATRTAALADMLVGTKARLKDTRKTTPGFRAIEKWAVAIGGGVNHRFCLADQVMLKDNHIDAAGGIRPAMESMRRYLKEHKLDLPVEIETRTLTEVQAAIDEQPDMILFDNMEAERLREAVKLVAGRCQTEASGGITAHNLRAVAETGVDYISVGALTHSVRSLDLSLKVAGQS